MFCVNASAEHQFIEQTEATNPNTRDISQQTPGYGIINCNASWIRGDNYKNDVVSLSNYEFGDNLYAYPLKPHTMSNPKLEYIYLDFGHNGSFYGSTLDDLLSCYVDLGSNTTNALNIDFNTNIGSDGYTAYITSATVTLALDSASSDPNASFNNCFKTFTVNFDKMQVWRGTESLQILFNTVGHYTRFVSCQIQFGDFNGGYNSQYFPKRYMNIAGISIVDPEKAEDRSFLSGLIDSILSAIKSIPDNLKGFFSSLGDRIGGFFSDLTDSFEFFIIELGNRIHSFFESLLEGIKSLFIPADGFFQEKLTTLQKQAEDHLGLLYEIPAFVVGIIHSLIDHIANVGYDRVIEYPALEYDGYTLIKAGSIDFQYYIDMLEEHNIYTIYKTFVSVIGAVWFINFAYNKLQVIWGSDYS